MHETISSTDGLKASCESFGMCTYCLIYFIMHLDLIIVNKDKTEVKKTDWFYSFFISFRATKKIEFRGCKRKFRDMKDRKGPSQPLKMKKIGNEGKRLVEKSENRCRTHWGHENNRPCSNSFDPGGSRQANSQVGVIHLVFALQILHL